MTTPKYRISMVVWDYGTKNPRTSALLQNFAAKDLAEEKVAADANVETKRLNDEWHKENPGHIENPFVLDDCSDCAAVIRFWDGNDYQFVEMYNVYTILDKGDNWCYRDYRIVAKNGVFNVEKDNVFVGETVALNQALDMVDKLSIKETVKCVA